MNLLKKIIMCKRNEKTTFSDRISYLCNIFGPDRLAELISGADSTTIGEWSNKRIVADVPIGVSFAPLLFKYPSFSTTWLNEGLGEIFNNGTVDVNESAIRERESRLKIARSV